MKQLFKLTVVILVLVTSCKSPYSNLEDGLYAEIKTTKGTMVAKLAFDKVPAVVANFVSLAEGNNTIVDSLYKDKKFYNGLTFHRVVDQFMIQGGDPWGNGKGNPGYRFGNQFHPDLKHDKPGILAMANAGRPKTNGSQFYITEVPRPDLDNRYSVFGELVLGIEIQDSISNIETVGEIAINPVIIEEINIIRKGSEAKDFDAPKVFKDFLISEAKKEKKRKERRKEITRATNEKFYEQEEKAIALASGLRYFISEKGEGEKLSEDDLIRVHYAVYFKNGTLIKTSNLKTAEALEMVNEQRKNQNGYQPIIADISPDADMIPGFKEGLQQLNVGDKATIFVPYHLAYGEAGRQGIPPKSNLIFEVEVIELAK
ncbi:peptidylprolyl isomerase [Seonamhaeicola marinus]|uniref:peptidylprolyl isomerase n=1 Tax=Seonamhaeicola marinus TaxID=1912246 RepID=A0A5D0ILJ0_9FLAO|nr:peptidylprolyl isomerase [Seonamhaeicola marinus]TYA84384.1 peptidylprolyl isomerase [Seonamhaeicola marinus]